MADCGTITKFGSEAKEEDVIAGGVSLLHIIASNCTPEKASFPIDNNESPNVTIPLML